MIAMRNHHERGTHTPEDAGAAPRAGFLATLRAVLWSFIGVRRRRDHERDARSLDPRAVVVAGLIGGLVFVLILVAVVRLVAGA